MSGARLRYLSLCGLFGALVGLRYSLDVWVFQRIGFSGDTVLVLVGYSFAGMLIGELAAPLLSDRSSRALAIAAAAAGLAAWALLALIGIALESAAWLYGAGLCFGIGLGLYHSSLDAWLDETMERDHGHPATDRQLTEGFLLYNLGYLAASILAFPLLYRLQWRMDLYSDAAAVLAPTPYLLALLLAAAAFRLRPPDRSKTRVTFAPLFALPLKEYRRVIRHGRFGIVTAIAVGTSINLLVQYIDHFAPANLLPGNTVASRTLDILAFNLTVVLVIAALDATLARRFPARKLSHGQRETIIAVALLLTVALVVVALRPRQGGELGLLHLTPILIGLAQSSLLAVLPLIKSWMLTYAVDDLRATALSLLGVAKRSLGIGATLGLYFAGDTTMGNGIDNDKLLWILFGFAGFCLAALAGHAFMRRLRQRRANPLTGS